MDYYTIHIDGKQFQKNYLIYIIQLKHKSEKKYFYVGQTGDRYYKTARPAFRRLAGHLEDRGNSTQNQLYKAIAEQILEKHIVPKAKFSEDVKDAVSRYLMQSEIEMFVFPVLKFDDSMDSDQHKENVRYIENIEKILIKNLIVQLGTNRILNKKRNKPEKISNSEVVAEEIFNTII